MKVVLLHNLFGDDARGGGEVVVAAQAVNLLREGNDVVVITPGEKESWEKADGYVVKRVVLPMSFLYRDLFKAGFFARLGWHFKNIFSRDIARSVVSAIAECRPDVVYTHNMMGLGYSTMREIQKRWRHVHTCHDVQMVWLSGLLPAEKLWSWWQNTACRIQSKVLSRIVGSPDEVIFPSEFLKDFYRRFGFFKESKCVVKRNVIEVGQWKGGKVEKDGFVYVGLLEPHKGIRLLFDVWEAMGFEAPRLRVVGDGSLRAEIEKRAMKINDMCGDERVVMLGRLGREEVARELVPAKYTVVPSLVIENSPTVIIESLAYGTPVIASDVGGIPELVRIGEDGILFEVGDRIALEKAVRKYRQK